MNCPTCKNPIQLNSTECEWCGNEIIKIPSQDNNLDLENKLIELCKKNNLLAAVKMKMQNSQMSLKEAKNYIDNLVSKIK